MARTWLQIRVELKGGRDIVCDPPPGRVLMIGPSHSFADLAEAIDAAFARWDLGHLHEFVLADGRRVGIADPDDETGPLDGGSLRVARALSPGDEFTYVFDFGDEWMHHCRVLPDKVDPAEEYGMAPRDPVAIDGWGWIPDQYGREREQENE